MRRLNIRFLGVMLLLWAASSAALAQESDVRLEIDAQRIGLGSVVRPGDWTPMLVSLENRATTPRQVRCVWVTSDVDGDQVLWTRQLTLTPQRKQRAWLYAAVPVSANSKTQWRVDVIDSQSNQLIASQVLALNQPAERNEALIGVTSTLALGMDPYGQVITQHEAVRTIRGLDPAALPDRWYGLASLQALVWTPDAVDPSSPAVSPQTHQAIRQWVRRGGHLIIVLPSVGEVWSRSALADMLPAAKLQKVQGEAPTFLGAFRSSVPHINMTWFEPGPDTVVLLRDQQRPLVVARQYGFGRVTMIGVDLTDRDLVANAVPNGDQLWNTVFGWRGPALPRKRLQELVDGTDPDNRYSEPTFRPAPIELASFIPGLIAMRETAATALLAAILLFALYWVVAGPVPIAVLRQKNKLEHSWLIFLTVVLFFSLVSWSAAIMLRPHQTRISHVSVLDLDASSKTAHARAWLSLFVPRHDQVEVALAGPDSSEDDNTLSTSGLLGRSPTEQAEYLDTQRYEVNCGSPAQAAFPFRSTARQLELDFLAPLTYLDEALPQEYLPPQVVFEPRGARWAARVSHGLPGALRDVIVLYCEGDGKVIAFRHPDTQWDAGEVVQIEPAGGVELLVGTRRSPELPASYPPHKDTISYLGLLRKLKPGGVLAKDDPTRIVLSTNQRIPLMEMLSFYSAMPPLDYEFDSRGEAVAYHRSVGRALDMTHLLHLRRLILIGFMDDAPLPAPLTVNGRTVPSSGWTIVRWIHPLPAQADADSDMPVEQAPARTDAMTGN